VLDYSNSENEPKNKDMKKLSDRQVLALSGGKAANGKAQTIDGF
jgi:hypothetical protein